MAARRAAFDLERALLDPGAVFARPESVLRRAGLAPDQKIEILRRWAYDAAEADVATEEGMPGNDNDLLRRILLALEELTGGFDAAQTGPTKQAGLPRSATEPKT